MKAPNGVVRVNALELLIEAFPLQDPNSSREERDELIQKQFDILQVVHYKQLSAIYHNIVYSCLKCSFLR